MEFEALSTDNTALFRARIKMLRMKQPQQRRPSVAESIGEATVLLSVNSERFKVYAAQSRNICAHIRELKDLIMDKRKSYLLSTVNAYGHDNLMSDSDRKQCDEQMGNFFSLFSILGDLLLLFVYNFCFRSSHETMFSSC